MDQLVEGHYYRHKDHNQLILITKIDFEAGTCSCRTININGYHDTTAPIEFFLFNYRYYSP